MIQRNIGTIVLLILGSVFSIVGGVAGFGFGKPMLDKAKASAAWPTTDGQVIESELVRHHDNDGHIMYKALVVYQYSLDGGDFESDQVWYGGGYSTSDRSEMKAIVMEYPVGKKVTVYYSPDKADGAVLKPGAFFTSYILFGIGLIFLTIGSLMLLGLAARLVFVLMAPGATESLTNTIDDEMYDTDRDSFGPRDSRDAVFNDNMRDIWQDDDDRFGGIPGC